MTHPLASIRGFELKNKKAGFIPKNAPIGV